MRTARLLSQFMSGACQRISSEKQVRRPPSIADATCAIPTSILQDSPGVMGLGPEAGLACRFQQAIETSASCQCLFLTPVARLLDLRECKIRNMAVIPPRSAATYLGRYYYTQNRKQAPRLYCPVHMYRHRLCSPHQELATNKALLCPDGGFVVGPSTNS